MIYTIGDSHAWHAWLNVPGVTTYPGFGPMTMFRLGREPIIKPLEAFGIPKDTVAIMTWGEVDCRCHVHVHQPWKECIEDIVARYRVRLKDFESQLKQIILYNVVPPPRAEKCLETYDPGNGIPVGFPFVGSNEIRKEYVQYMNKLLSESGYPFIDVYKEFADKDGYMACGQVHAQDEKPLIQWLADHKEYLHGNTN